MVHASFLDVDTLSHHLGMLVLIRLCSCCSELADGNRDDDVDACKSSGVRCRRNSFIETSGPRQISTEWTRETTRTKGPWSAPFVLDPFLLTPFTCSFDPGMDLLQLRVFTVEFRLECSTHRLESFPAPPNSKRHESTTPVASIDQEPFPRGPSQAISHDRRFDGPDFSNASKRGRIPSCHGSYRSRAP